MKKKRIDWKKEIIETILGYAAIALFLASQMLAVYIAYPG